MKTAYQFNEAGIYVGETVADESPLEPGVYLLPLRCTFVAPPEEIPDGKVPRWNGSSWGLANIVIVQPQVENPLAKLQEFLNNNPDVAELLNTGGV